MFKHNLLATAVALACAGAQAADYYVVTPVKGRTVNTSAIDVSLASSTLPLARMGNAYSYDFKQHLQVTGDPTYTGYGLKWAVVGGSLPAGLTLDASTGVVAGTPLAGGTFPFQVSATYKTKAGTQTYQILATSVTVSLAAATPPSAMVGSAYSYDLKALLSVAGDPDYTGTGVTWSVVSGTLPTGLTLGSNGVISGTPSAVSSSTITARATYKSVTGERSYQVSAVVTAVPRWEVASLDFGNVLLGTTATRTVKLYNDGNIAAAWSGLSGLNASVTADTSACASVAIGSYCSVSLQYRPTALGSLSLNVAPTGTTMSSPLVLAGMGVQRMLALSPSVSGKSTWNLDADGPLVLSTSGRWTITPLTALSVNVKAWGGGGGSTSAGAGGYAGGTVAFAAASYTVDLPGQGASSGPNPSGPRGDAGGAYAGLFSDTSVTMSSVMLVAGGGGGSTGGTAGGAGGGVTAANGANSTNCSGIAMYGRGGTSAAGGAPGTQADANSVPPLAGSALAGGTGGGWVSTAGAWTSGGGGGGGYYGGGGGIGGGSCRGGAGGGSSYVGGAGVSSGATLGGVGATPGNSADANRGTGGNPGTLVGRIVIQ